MTNFTETAMRHYCRNAKCRMKLPTPVSNMREAFCTKGCRERFYRLRCYVCDEKKPGRLDAHTCGRRKCKNAMRTLKSPSATGRVEIGVGESIESGVGKPLKPGRAWRIIAGTLTPSQFHCATVPDGPDCQWKGGEYERIEAKNRAALKAAEQAEIEASGYFTEPGWREVVSPDGVLCFVIRFAPSQKRARQDLLPPMPDDLSIPEFLDRRSRKSPAMRLAAPHPWPPTGLRRSSAPEERSLEFPQVRNPSRARVG
jgi:hypothetical protein